jgi:hypothetical protein
MDKLRIATAAFAILAGTGMMAGTASAMPINGQLAATTSAATDAQQVRWGCGPYRCGWRPGGYYYGGPRLYGWRGGYWHRPLAWRGGWGWHRRWG